MTCPECGAKTKTVNGVVKYHTRPGDLSACPLSRTKPKTTASATAPTAEPKPEPAKKATRKAPAKKATPTS